MAFKINADALSWRIRIDYYNQFGLLEDWGADAAVGGLDVEHGADGGGDVGHVGET